MHYLHIFNTCTVTDLRYGGKEITYYTKDYKIELKCIKKAPNALYMLTITNKQENPAILDNVPIKAGYVVFSCECFITAENYEVLTLCGLVDKEQVYKIVINKTFCL